MYYVLCTLYTEHCTVYNIVAGIVCKLYTHAHELTCSTQVVSLLIYHYDQRISTTFIFATVIVCAVIAYFHDGIHFYLVYFGI